MTLQEQAQTIRFFEGLGKPLSTREIEILAEDEGRTCGDCRYFARGYCYDLHRPRVAEPDDLACQWFKRRG